MPTSIIPAFVCFKYFLIFELETFSYEVNYERNEIFDFIRVFHKIKILIGLYVRFALWQIINFKSFGDYFWHMAKCEQYLCCFCVGSGNL